jgi:hypothetical protein
LHRGAGPAVDLPQQPLIGDVDEPGLPRSVRRTAARGGARLELDHVDFLRREVRVQQQLAVTSGRSPFLAPVKTKTSRRTIELPQVTAEALALHLEEFPLVGVEVDDEADARSPRRRPARLLFTNAERRAIHLASWSHVWRPAARKVGLPPRTGYHASRHYFATLLIFAGASVKTVQVALGHSAPTITLNTYVGLWPDQVDRTRTLVDEALGTLSAEALSPRCVPDLYPSPGLDLFPVVRALVAHLISDSW